MGLPGSGKTTLAKNLWKGIPDSIWYNADEVRKKYDDWDFSITGRERQAIRMSLYAIQIKLLFATLLHRPIG